MIKKITLLKFKYQSHSNELIFESLQRLSTISPNLLQSLHYKLIEEVNLSLKNSSIQNRIETCLCKKASYFDFQ